MMYYKLKEERTVASVTLSNYKQLLGCSTEVRGLEKNHSDFLLYFFLFHFKSLEFFWCFAV